MFRKLFKKKGTITSEISGDLDVPLTPEFVDMYKRLWSHITNNAENLEVEECINKPREYACNNQEIYVDRGIDWESTTEKRLRWIGLVNIALRNNFAFEIDYNETLDEFIANVEKLGFTGNFDNLNAEEDVQVWVKQLDREWKKKKECFYMIDIDSDSYVLFIGNLKNDNYFKYVGKQLGEEIKRVVEPDPIEVTASMFNITLDQFDVMDRDYASITLLDTEPDIFSSKVGGLPYIDDNYGVPTNDDQIPLRLLAQINFKDLPELSMKLPSSGILQFWIKNNDMYGLSFDENDKGFSVRFIKSIDTSITEAMVLKHYSREADNEMFPFEGAFGMTFTKCNQPYPLYLDMYQELFIQKWNQLYPESIIVSVDEFGTLLDEAIDATSESGHKIGGFPFFTQYDPRESIYDPQSLYTDHELLLFQLDTDHVGSREIMWGDSGIANFFISKEDLENLDFTKVLYNWDCF